MFRLDTRFGAPRRAKACVKAALTTNKGRFPADLGRSSAGACEPRVRRA